MNLKRILWIGAGILSIAYTKPDSMNDGRKEVSMAI